MRCGHMRVKRLVRDQYVDPLQHLFIVYMDILPINNIAYQRSFLKKNIFDSLPPRSKQSTIPLSLHPDA